MKNGWNFFLTRIRARDRKGLERLLMYMARGPIAQSRLTRDEDPAEQKSTVDCYDEKRVHHEHW